MHPVGLVFSIVQLT